MKLTIGRRVRLLRTMDPYSFDTLRKKIKRLRRESRQQFQTLLQELSNMHEEMEALRQEVSRNTEVTQSVLTLVQGFADQVEAHKNEPEVLQQLVDELRTNNQALADAVAANVAE